MQPAMPRGTDNSEASRPGTVGTRTDRLPSVHESAAHVDEHPFELQQGSVVCTGDGAEVGTVDRFVVHPARRELTHLIVSLGRIFATERVVPIDAVETAVSDEVRLVPGLVLDDLVPFEVDHYVDLDEATNEADYPGAVDAPIVWSHPDDSGPVPVTATLTPKYPMGYQRVVERSVRTDARIVTPGIPVCSSDGEKLGKVVAVAADPSGGVVSISVDPGWFRSEQRIGVQFIASIEPDRVTLAVTAETIGHLERQKQ